MPEKPEGYSNASKYLRGLAMKISLGEDLDIKPAAFIGVAEAIESMQEEIHHLSRDVRDLRDELDDVKAQRENA